MSGNIMRPNNIYLWSTPPLISQALAYTLKKQTWRKGGFFLLFVFLFCFVLFFHLFRAAPAAYGASQARGQIRATGLHHSSWQHWILNPLSKARDQTCILRDTSHFCWATAGTLIVPILEIKIVGSLSTQEHLIQLQRLGTAKLQWGVLTYITIIFYYIILFRWDITI